MGILIRVAAAAGLALLPCGASWAQMSEFYGEHRSRPAAGWGDSHIVGVLDTAHENELAAARLAQERSQNEDVRAYAQRMLDEHGAAQQRLRETGVEARGSVFKREIEDKARRERSRLSRLEGGAFDRAYIAGEVESHARVLRAIDEEFIPDVKAGAVAKEVHGTRDEVAAHLEEARRLKGELGRR